MSEEGVRWWDDSDRLPDADLVSLSGRMQQGQANFEPNKGGSASSCTGFRRTRSGLSSQSQDRLLDGALREECRRIKRIVGWLRKIVWSESTGLAHVTALAI